MRSYILYLLWKTKEVDGLCFPVYASKVVRRKNHYRRKGMTDLRRKIMNDLDDRISRLNIPEPDREYTKKSSLRWKNRRIYFIQAETGEIKIGSANNVRHRLECFQIGCPCKLIILKSKKIKELMPERELFKKFSKHRKYGEWFYPADELLDFIKNL